MQPANRSRRQPVFVEDEPSAQRLQWWRRKRPGRMTNGLIAASATAILSVYAVGYVTTQASEESLATLPAAGGSGAASGDRQPSQAATSPAVNRLQGSDPTATPTATVPTSTAATSTTPAGGGSQPVAPTSQATSPQTTAPAATPTATRAAIPTPTPAKAASGYRDGSYVGNGNSRHGGIEATVVISGGKIVSASVTNCGTRYPCSKVTPLVNEVVAIQAAPTHYVSGATDSSNAYHQAIANALAQAK